MDSAKEFQTAAKDLALAIISRPGDVLPPLGQDAAFRDWATKWSEASVGFFGFFLLFADLCFPQDIFLSYIKDPANSALEFDIDAGVVSKQVRAWNLERADVWRAEAKAAARKAFLETVDDDELAPVSKKVPEVDAQSGDDKESEHGDAVGKPGSQKRLNDVESGSDEVAEVEHDKSPKTETKNVWDAKDPSKRLRAEVVIPPAPFPMAPMSAHKKRVRPGFLFLL